MIKKIEIFEKSIYDIVKPYLIDKFAIARDNFTSLSTEPKRYYLLEIREEIINGRLNAKKLYTLTSNNKMKKNKHQFYNILPEDLEKVIVYKSNNLKDAYDVLTTFFDSKKYNL